MLDRPEIGLMRPAFFDNRPIGFILLTIKLNSLLIFVYYVTRRCVRMDAVAHSEDRDLGGNDEP